MPNHDVEQFVSACGTNQVSAVRRMLSEGYVDINASNSSGVTGLYVAMRNNKIDTVRLLLAHSDIQINSTDSIGRTALHTACLLHGSVESVRLFLAHPACTRDFVTKVNSLRKTAEMEDRSIGSDDRARLLREYLETENKSDEVDDVQRMVEMIKSGETTGEGTTRLEDMTLTEVAKGIEKINAVQPIIEAANSKVKDEHNKELAKLEAEHNNKLKSLVESHKRKVDSIVDKQTMENNKCKKLRAENEERKKSLNIQLQALLSPPGQPANPPPPPPSSLIPSCPVCLESMRPPLQIFTCGNGHLVCSVCRPKVIMDKCHCQAMYMGRATAMEQMVRQVLGIM